MFDGVFCTDERRWHAAPLRAVLGAVFVLHGVRGLAEGAGGGSAGPILLGLSIAAGFLTRPAAALMLAVAAAGLTRFLGDGGMSLPEFDLALTIMGAAAALAVIGGGRCSVDSLIQERLIYCHFSTDSREDGVP